jgi:hypothetical protein
MFDRLAQLFIPQKSNNYRPRLVQPATLAIIVSFVLTSQALLSYITVLYPTILGYASQIPPAQVIEITNQKRAEAGLPPVVYNDQLSDAARRKAADMFAKDYWAHNAPDGTKPWSFILAAGYNYLHAGENLARDFTNPQAVVDAWMASPTHRDNIMNARYQDIGIAVVDGQLGGVETTLVVQMFGTPQSTAPALTQGSQTTLVREAIAQEPTAPTLTPTQKPQLPDATPTPTPEQFVPTQISDLNYPLINTFTLSKVISLSFVILIFVVLLIDWYVAWDKNLIRISGRNWAHLAYLGLVIALSLIIKQGLIL